MFIFFFALITTYNSLYRKRTDQTIVTELSAPYNRPLNLDVLCLVRVDTVKQIEHFVIRVFTWILKVKCLIWFLIWFIIFLGF